jgi:hypothetical protein
MKVTSSIAIRLATLASGASALGLNCRYKLSCSGSDDDAAKRLTLYRQHRPEVLASREDIYIASQRKTESNYSTRDAGAVIS